MQEACGRTGRWNIDGCSSTYASDRSLRRTQVHRLEPRSSPRLHVNSAAQDLGPAISKNGLSLYFGSGRAAPDAQGGMDLYVAQRLSLEAPWGSPRNLGAVVNSPFTDNIPSLSRDGHLMFFNSNRPGGFGDVDLWVAFRDHVHDDFAWQAPFNLGQGVNSAGFDAGAGYFENDDGGTPLLFFGRGTSQATQETTTDFFVSELQADRTFGPARLIPELSSPTGDQRPIIRFDGLEIFFTSNRPGSTPDALGALTRDIWVATRNSVHDHWSTPSRSVRQSIQGPRRCKLTFPQTVRRSSSVRTALVAAERRIST